MGGQQELEAIDSTLNALQNQVFGANEKMDGFKLEMNWNQEELEQWALASRQKEEDNLTLQKYKRMDEGKIKELSLNIEKLTTDVNSKARDLEKEITETQTAQIELDRTAEEFGKEHNYRNQLWSQWKQVVDEIRKRDEIMEKMQDELVNLEDMLKEKNRSLEDKGNQLKTQKKQNKEDSETAAMKERIAVKTKEQYKQLNETMNDLQAEVQI